MIDDRSDDEPTMDEILTSIRKIIADEDDEDKDGNGGGKPRYEPKLKPLELGPESRIDDDDDSTDDDDVELIPVDSAKPADKDKAMDDQAKTDDPALLSEQSSSASMASMAKLAQSARSSTEIEPIPGSRQTVEAFLREMMRQPLKDWLDSNLPAIVQRVVEEEVKKLAKRAELQ